MNHEVANSISTDNSKKAPWPTADLFLGISLLAVLFVVQSTNPFADDPLMSQLFQFGLTVTSLSCMALFALYMCKKRNIWPLIEKAPLKSFLREFFVSSWYMFLILLVCALLLFIPAMILKPGMNHAQVISSSGVQPNSMLVVALLVVVITLGPVAEELFFRGFLYNALKSRFSFVWAAILQALAFSAFHQYNLFNSLRVFLFGIAFVIIYEKRGKIISPISAHVFVNAVATLPLLFVTAFNLYPEY